MANPSEKQLNALPLKRPNKVFYIFYECNKAYLHWKHKFVLKKVGLDSWYLSSFTHWVFKIDKSKLGSFAKLSSSLLVPVQYLFELILTFKSLWDHQPSISACIPEMPRLTIIFLAISQRSPVGFSFCEKQNWSSVCSFYKILISYRTKFTKPNIKFPNQIYKLNLQILK